MTPPPEESLVLIRRAESKFREKTKGLSEPTRRILAWFLNEDNLKSLIGLPDKIYRKLSCIEPKISNVNELQSALAIEILLNAPITISKLANLVFNQNI